MFVGEAAVLGVVGSAIGAAIGVVVARASISRVPTIFLDFLGVRPSFVLPRTAIPAGILPGTGATIAATVFPARTAVSVAPVDAMRPEGVLEADGGEGATRAPLVVAGTALVIASGLAAAIGQGTLVLFAFMATTLGIVVLSFGMTGRLAALVGRVAHTAGATGRLAGAGIRRSPRRV